MVVFQALVGKGGRVRRVGDTWNSYLRRYSHVRLARSGTAGQRLYAQ